MYTKYNEIYWMIEQYLQNVFMLLYVSPILKYEVTIRPPAPYKMYLFEVINNEPFTCVQLSLF